MNQGRKAIESMRRAKLGGGGGGGGSVRGMLGALAAAGGVGSFAYVAYNSIFNVEGGYRAVMYNRLVGVKQHVYAEGTHFLVPFLERTTIYDVRARPRIINSLTGTRDLQMVNVSIRVLARPDASALPRIHSRLGPEYDEKVLPSIVNEVLKQVVAKFNAAELLTQREQVSRKIRNDLVERATEFDILLDDVSITDLKFGNDFMAAVEAKQVAQQDAERARYVVEKAKQDKKSTVIRAQGEARSAEMIGTAISDNPGFVELRRLEAAREIAATVSASQNRLYLNSDTLLLNLMGSTGFEQRVKGGKEPMK